MATKENAKKNTPAKAEAELHPCECGQYVFPMTEGGYVARIAKRGHGRVIEGDADNPAEFTTACSEGCKSTFAPGHDARLAGLLIAAGKDGEEAIHLEGNTAVAGDPVRAAYQISDLLGSKVEWALKLHREKQANKASKKAAPKPAAPAEDTPIKAKVGRWTYDGYLLADGSFEYQDAKGDAHNVTKFQVIAAA